MIRRRKIFTLTLAGILIFIAMHVYAQENVFALLKSDIRLADEYYAQKNYDKALQLYQKVVEDNPKLSAVQLKIARCFASLKEYELAASMYETCKKSDTHFQPMDLYSYAEVLASAGQYRKAIEIYRDYFKSNPDDTTAAQKIWRLSNAAYLYEDSVHYAVRSLSFNTNAGEICPRWHRDGIMFLSNRKEVQMIERLNQSNTTFYKTYFAKAFIDSLRANILSYKTPVLVPGEINSKLNSGPMAFYDGGKKIVFISNGKSEDHTGTQTLQMYFAEETNGKWQRVQSFPYNSNEYSITDPTISSDGTELYFSSDMKGGFGGKDIYRCDFLNGRWSKPTNLGSQINTRYDEVCPFIHPDRTLYFSSNGHPGLGGLDIFKAHQVDGQWSEVINSGYPINTSADEFGIVVDSLTTHGYFSSNRKRGGFDDDLYEFDIDLQNYPLTIAGVIHMKDNFTDTVGLQPFSQAKILLIDNIHNVTIFETSSDENGNFTILIPHFSKYRLSVTGSDGREHVVSLEIPKNKKIDTKHEIVIVKDFFQTPEIPSAK